MSDGSVTFTRMEALAMQCERQGVWPLEKILDAEGQRELQAARDSAIKKLPKLPKTGGGWARARRRG